jgi:hypothetical protein
MAITVDQPQRTDAPDSSDESARTQPSSEYSRASAVPLLVDPVARSPRVTRQLEAAWTATNSTCGSVG